MIEFAKPEDAPQIVALCCMSFEENKIGEAGIPKSIDKALQVILDCIIEHVILVKRNEQNPKLIDGILVTQAATDWWTETVVLHSLMFYIKPEFRTFKLVKEFIDEIKKYVILNKTALVFDVFGQMNASKKSKLMKYLGFKDFGSALIFTPGET
jgi:hypothetical protein